MQKRLDYVHFTRNRRFGWQIEQYCPETLLDADFGPMASSKAAERTLIKFPA